MLRFAPPDYGLNIFINCPFDRQYLKLFYAVVFAVHDCGFIARCALEVSDTSQVRVSKILKIIAECRIGIHDISRTELDTRHRLPRFNMPLELGMFLGAKQYGNAVQKQKICLVLDRDPYRYQKFCSDIAGQDISAHGGKVDLAIAAVRNFLGGVQQGVIIPGPKKITRRYAAFSKQLPALCRALGLTKAEVGFGEYATMVAEWLKENPRA